MGSFLDGIKRSVEKYRVEKWEYESACDRIFEENAKNYEKLFPRMLESVGVQGENEVFDLERMRRIKNYYKNNKRKIGLVGVL